MKICIEIAGVTAELNHKYGYITALTRDYRTEKPPKITVSVTDAEIEREFLQNGGRFGADICEATCLHRNLVRALVPYGVMLIHSAAIAVDGKAYVFLAKSGVGKSTHIGLWKSLFGDRARVVNGDKPLFTFDSGILTVHGSPWRGKEGLGEPISCPVEALCFLSRGTENRISPADKSDAVTRIFHQILLPKDSRDQTAVISFLDRIIREVPLFCLECNREEDAAITAYRGMRKDNL